MANLDSEWRDFLEKLRKQDKNHADPNSLYSILSGSELIKDNADELVISLPDDRAIEAAYKKFNRRKNKKKMPLQWQSRNFSFCLPVIHVLQTLKHESLGNDNDRPEPALYAAATTEQNCGELYDRLNTRTRQLAGDSIIEVEFGSRVRVGGVRGFLDTLLPALHPVYGVPYIPSSTLKGIVRAWARENPKDAPTVDVDRILGFIDRKNDPETNEKYENPRSSLGTVQFFDAYPKAPCLDLDVVTPNWSWNGTEEVKYQAAPHAFLVMNCPTLVLGVAATSIGDRDDVELVELWLEEALARGLGSRTSAGYGRVAGRYATLPEEYVRSYSFEMKTQGIYGIDCPTKENNNQGTPEFRTTAVRGVLRYWFRAIALGIYSKEWCKRLEEDLFGSIEPVPRVERDNPNAPIRGSVGLCVELTKTAKKGSKPPFEYRGTIYLESKHWKHLEAVSKLLELASHLSGIGRGSRRPLHQFLIPNTSKKLDRGCFWQLTESQYQYGHEDLGGLVEATLAAIVSLGGNDADCRPALVDVGRPSARKQDVFDRSARLFVLPQQGLQAQGRGVAMELLYTTPYKGGVPRRSGNPHVGGAANDKLSTPSYVTVQTNRPSGGIPYEAIIVFDAASDDKPEGDMYQSRSQFCADLIQQGAIEVPISP